MLFTGENVQVDQLNMFCASYVEEEETNMKKNLLGKMVITGIISAAMLASTAASTWAADKSDKDVLRVGMECAYAPFNWTQDTDTTPDGSKAEPIYGSDYYAYGYDVAVAQKLADQLGMKLEIHKVEWSSIGISMDAGDYDCIIAGMGKTAEREKSYAFTEPYYYRDNCIVVKAGGKYDDVKGLSDLAGNRLQGYHTAWNRMGTASGSDRRCRAVRKL